MDGDQDSEPPGPRRTAPTGWWPEPDTIALVRRSGDAESDQDGERPDQDG